MVGVWILGALAVLGYVQGIPTPTADNAPSIIEDMRKVSGSRIVGGWEANEGQIPHQVSLRMVSTAGAVSSCGGSIIHHCWILTAAHCAASRLTFVVRIGVTDLTRPAYLTETTNKAIHPRYSEWLGGVQTDDIALLGLTVSIPYGKYVQPIRLQNSESKNRVFTGVVFTVSGFGRTDDAWNGGSVSEVLLWTHLRGITNEECRYWYDGSSIIQQQTICAEYYNETSQSSCQGDSGGPLTFVDVDGQPTQVGLVSFGHRAGCNSPYPSAYVRPGHYMEWIAEVTGIQFDWSYDDLKVSSESQDIESA